MWRKSGVFGAQDTVSAGLPVRFRKGLSDSGQRNVRLLWGSHCDAQPGDCCEVQCTLSIAVRAFSKA